MKYFCFLLILGSMLNAQAKIWRVNNSGVAADFSTAQEAHDGAQPGDTLHFESSPAEYGQLNVTKKLVIIGPGIFLGQNPELQVSRPEAKIGYVKFLGGSDGSVLTGMYLINGLNVEANNIIIARNYIQSILFLGEYQKTHTNIIIIQNYFIRSIAGHANSNFSGIVISNNYFQDNSSFPNTHSGVFENNVLNCYSNKVVRFYNFTIANNIMVKGGMVEVNNNTFSHNLSSGTQFPAGNGNLQDVDMSTIFKGSTGNSTDGQWQLKEGSPAIGAGTNGVDAGMFGGANPYVLSAIPAIPAIYFLEVPFRGNSNNILKVQLKARSNP